MNFIEALFLKGLAKPEIINIFADHASITIEVMEKVMNLIKE